MLNYERIRQMNVDELAEFMTFVVLQFVDGCCPENTKNFFKANGEKAKLALNKDHKNWLMKEVEDNG